jgi:chemotaxis protein methyltransferase CheR
MFDFFKKKEIIVSTPELQETPEDYNDIELIAKYFQNETGITFDRQMSILKNKVITFCKQKKIYSFKQLLKDIQSTPKLKQEIIDYLTTNETYFYREFNQIQKLVQLVRNNTLDIKILCAPSATGEEAYSIAIALLEAGVSANTINIIGIDINQEAVTKANIAIYSERNIRNLSPSILHSYFTKKNDKYILKESIKTLVTFKLANIFDESFKNLGKFDFVFSRNMLIYFNQETKLKAKNILEDMRKDTKHNVFFGHADLF